MIETIPSTVLASVSRVSKWFGATRALHDVSIDFRAGEIHALVGANGSGKSTLAKVLSGLIQPERGDVAFAPVTAAIHQDLGLFGEGTVLENVIGGHNGWLFPRLSLSGQRREARRTLDQLGAPLDLDDKVCDLTVELQAVVAVARALVACEDSERVLLIADEVTSVLRGVRAEVIVGALRRLRDAGMAIVFVSHDLDEVLALADRITVLRDGELKDGGQAASFDRDRLIELMTGQSIAATQAIGRDREEAGRAIALDVQGLSGGFLFDLRFRVEDGEIVGITGSPGSGYDEVPYLVTGTQRARSGRVAIGGREIRCPRDFAIAGGRIVPADRSTMGAIPSASVLENFFLDHLGGRSRFGVSAVRSERAQTQAAVREYGVKCSSIDAPISSLSGGNQQKLILARCIASGPRFLVLHEPTQGVDVAARSDLLSTLRQAMKRRNMGALYVCGDLDELWDTCSRILVVRRGRLAGDVHPGRDAKGAALRLMH